MIDLAWFDGRVLLLVIAVGVLAFQLGGILGYARGVLDGRDQRDADIEEKRRCDSDRRRALRVIDGGCSARVYDFEAER